MPILGGVGETLQNFLRVADITGGVIFRGISRGGNLRAPASEKYGGRPYTVTRIAVATLQYTERSL